MNKFSCDWCGEPGDDYAEDDRVICNVCAKRMSEQDSQLAIENNRARWMELHNRGVDINPYTGKYGGDGGSEEF